MTRETEKEPSDPSNGPVSNGPAVEEVANDIINVLAQRVHEIKENKALRSLLKEWKKDYEASEYWLLQTEARLQNVKNELYQWIGFYSVFQGAVLTSVTLTTTLGCRQSWCPTSLSLIASIVTIVTVHFKLRDYGIRKIELQRRSFTAKKLHARIARLKEQGKDFEFYWFSEKSQCSSGESGRKTVGRKDRYYWAAIGALLLFSSVVVLCCNIILCGPTKYHPGS
ncbi:unnamed protein product [Sphagnum balticum]